jgi:mRNA interferase RelE/StbE
MRYAIEFTAAEKLLRIRIGAYRVIYQVLDDVLRVLVVTIGHRRDVYR